MNRNTKNGLFALGLAAVAAWYKMSPDQKANLKNKVSGIGNKLKDNLNNLKNQAVNQTKSQSAS